MGAPPTSTSSAAASSKLRARLPRPLARRRGSVRSLLERCRLSHRRVLRSGDREWWQELFEAGEVPAGNYGKLGKVIETTEEERQE